MYVILLQLKSLKSLKTYPCLPLKGAIRREYKYKLRCYHEIAEPTAQSAASIAIIKLNFDIHHLTEELSKSTKSPQAITKKQKYLINMKNIRIVGHPI